LCREFGPESILINVIGPGKIATKRVNHLDSINANKEGISLEDFQQRNAKAIPLGRYGSADEIAKPCSCIETPGYVVISIETAGV
jgi:3-oxoacyl-[acyl-carrier protein] reductase